MQLVRAYRSVLSGSDPRIDDVAIERLSRRREAGKSWCRDALIDPLFF
jgi:hypothetical protein